MRTRSRSGNPTSSSPSRCGSRPCSRRAPVAAFSDTNFLILGQILQQASGKQYPQLVKAQVLDRAGLSNTSFPTTSAIPDPVLHSYTNERGNYEEATFWSPSDFPNSGSVVTTLDDLGKWTTALGTGKLLSKESFDLQTGDQNVGLGPLTADRHYGMGVVIVNGWTLTNPQFDGYTGVIAHLPAKKATVVVASTFGPKGDISVSTRPPSSIASLRRSLPRTPPTSRCARGAADRLVHHEQHQRRRDPGTGSS